MKISQSNNRTIIGNCKLYQRDFIPRAAQYTSSLSKLLKKNSSPWSEEQTIAVKELKKIAQNPSALKIPGIGQRILQTDASDH